MIKVEKPPIDISNYERGPKYIIYFLLIIEGFSGDQVLNSIEAVFQIIE